MIKTTITVIALSMFTWGCSNSATESPSTQTQSDVQEEHHHDDEAIALDNGKKWKVDEQMMAHIRNMENDINAFQGKSVDEYAALSNKVNANIELLTSNCTMKGQAHDELHKWLLPYIDLSDEFNGSETEQESAENYQKIKSSFKTFNTYFE